MRLSRDHEIFALRRQNPERLGGDAAGPIGHARNSNAGRDI
jgi:hypothetical protein